MGFEKVLKGNIKITFITGAFPTVSETFITRQLICAQDLGYDVRILTTKFNPLALGSQDSLIREHGLDNKVIEFKKFSFGGRRAKYLAILRAFLRGAPLRLIKSSMLQEGKDRWSLLFYYDQLRIVRNSDLFHIQFGVNQEPIISLKEHGVLPGKIVVTFHGYDAHFTEYNKAEVISRYARLFKHASLITANTSYLSSKLIEIGCPKEKLRIVPTGVDTTFFKPLASRHTKSDRFMLLSVGRLVELKGFLYGIRVVALLKKRGITVSYHIIGDGQERDKLSSEINEQGLQDQVSLLGSMDQNQVVEALQYSDLYLMPGITDGDGRAEAQGVVSYEAQACGVPVIAFDSGGISSTLIDHKTGYLIKEMDVAGMADRIEELLKNDSRRIEMGIAARKHIEMNFSAKATCKRWQELYASL